MWRRCRTSVAVSRSYVAISRQAGGGDDHAAVSRRRPRARWDPGAAEEQGAVRTRTRGQPWIRRLQNRPLRECRTAPAGAGAVLVGGRYWDRTSDLFRVREARYRCANRPCTRGRWGNGADDGTRTRDPHLGKVMLYQLSHVRTSARPTKEHPSAPAVQCANACGPSWQRSPGGAAIGTPVAAAGTPVIEGPPPCRVSTHEPGRPPTGRSSHPQMHGSPREACNILEVRLRGRAPRVEAPEGDWRSGSALPSHGRGHWFDPSIAHGEVHAVPPGKPWTTHCGRGSVGRASPCQGEGRGFESRRPLRERRTRHHCRERLFHKMRKHRGGLAERRGNGLQSRVHGFESRTHLHRRPRARQGRTTRSHPAGDWRSGSALP